MKIRKKNDKMTCVQTFDWLYKLVSDIANVEQVIQIKLKHVTISSKGVQSQSYQS